ncbi:uncharacterized protein A4U43_C04F29080 [Asparagus officinalis]|uniref:Uncharacterized protein n=1 Tax=Asparagus officinalis TaxID=4686 RepID=A0A5P1F9D5_ASPOF|nr:uncharacterized protein A4U43_C04F29080 [Asparagus officinalis]
MSSRGPSKSKTRRMAPKKLLHQARERQMELEGARRSISILSVPPSTSFCSDDREMNHITPESSYRHLSLRNMICRPLHTPYHLYTRWLERMPLHPYQQLVLYI